MSENDKKDAIEQYMKKFQNQHDDELTRQWRDMYKIGLLARMGREHKFASMELFNLFFDGKPLGKTHPESIEQAQINATRVFALVPEHKKTEALHEALYQVFLVEHYSPEEVREAREVHWPALKKEMGTRRRRKG